MPISIAVGLGPAFYPRHSPVGTHDAERILPAVPRWGANDFVQDAKHAGSVVFVDTARPCINGCRFFRREAVQLAKAIIPIYTTGTGIPRPGAPARGVYGELEPLFAFPQCLLGLYALGNVDIVPDHTHDATVLVVITAPPRREPTNLTRRTNDPELQVERFAVADSGITLGFHCGEIARIHQ